MFIGRFCQSQGGTVAEADPGPRETLPQTLNRRCSARATDRGTPRLPRSTESALRTLLATGAPNLHQLVEETLVREAYTHCSDNQVKSARALGITRNTLRTLLKRYGLLTDALKGIDVEWAEEATG